MYLGLAYELFRTAAQERTWALMPFDGRPTGGKAVRIVWGIVPALVVRSLSLKRKHQAVRQAPKR